jgi:hypothetical protein
VECHSNECSGIEAPTVSNHYYGLIEQIHTNYGYIGWVGDVNAFMDRFDEVPFQACTVLPEALGLKTLPPPNHLVALSRGLVWTMLSEMKLPLKPLDEFDD